jgi:hypothetical protein
VLRGALDPLAVIGHDLHRLRIHCQCLRAAAGRRSGGLPVARGRRRGGQTRKPETGAVETRAGGRSEPRLTRKLHRYKSTPLGRDCQG